jgi:hypothetical protein
LNRRRKTAGIQTTSEKFTLDDIANPSPCVTNVRRCLATCAINALNDGVGSCPSR